MVTGIQDTDLDSACDDERDINRTVRVRAAVSKEMIEEMMRTTTGDDDDED